MSNWATFHFHDTSRTAAVKRKQPVGDSAALRTDAGNLAPFLFALRESDRAHYDRIVDAVRMVAPFFRDFSLRPDRAQPDVIQLEWIHTSTDSYFNAQSLSDGTLRYMCLATLLLQPDPPSLVVIDEPELGLHPAAITQLAEMFRAAAATGHQVIASTQSVTLLNHLALDDVVIAEQRGGETTLERPDVDRLDQWIEEEYAVGELWEKNLLGGRPSWS